MTEQLIPETAEKMPPGLQLENVDDRIMTLNVGPQHPGSGHMRLIIKIDGDYIVDADPDPVTYIEVKKKWLRFEIIF